MAKNQKSYTPEFKQQIVDLYNAGGTSYPQLEREYGVNRSTLQQLGKTTFSHQSVRRANRYSKRV